MQTEAAFKRRLRSKLKETRFQQKIDSLVNLGSEPSISASLASLKNAPKVKIVPEQVEAGDCEFGRTHIIAHDITGAHFPELNVNGGKFYSRECYPGLYAAVGRVWKAGFNRVAVIGNAGTVKSWFQIYCLLQLPRCWQRRRHQIRGTPAGHGAIHLRLGRV
jgi:hypothetical protein